MVDQSGDTSSARDPVWTVPTMLRPYYFAQFSILGIIGIAFNTWYEITRVTDDNTADTIRDIGIGIAPVGVAAAVVSILTVETARFIMVVAEWLQEVLRKRRERQIAEARAEARAEAQAETGAEIHAAWAAWNRRRLDAEAKDEPFTEPPPSASD